MSLDSLPAGETRLSLLLPREIDSELSERASFLGITKTELVDHVLAGRLPSRRRIVIEKLEVEKDAEEAIETDGLSVGLVLDWHAGGWKRRPRFLPPPEPSDLLRVFRSRFHLTRDPEHLLVVSTYFGHPDEDAVTRVVRRPVRGL